MTRINVIEVTKLTDQHLLAEYRELPRVYHGVLRGVKTSLKDQPKIYTLGKGHEIFFRDKLLFLEERHKEIVDELLKRNFSLSIDAPLSESYPNEVKEKYKMFFNDYITTQNAVDTNAERILLRLRSTKYKITMNRRNISYEEIKNIYNKIKI